MKKGPIYTVSGGIIALIIVMGIGRFAYTPMLPLMQTAENLSDIFVGYLASSNYMGYLLGALAAGLINWVKGKTFYLRLFLLINILTTSLMGLAEQQLSWFLLRFLSGLTSGLVFVLASSIVIDTLARYQRLTWSGLFYSGVGIGIFLTGLLVPILDVYYDWQGAWIGLGILSIVLSIIAFLWLKEVSSTAKPKIETLSTSTSKLQNNNTQNKPSQHNQSQALLWLLGAYGCEGFGYIVSGTFIVAIVQQIPALSHYPTLSWMFVGVAAIPSCLLWAYIANSWGNILTLQVLFALQVIGVLLPIIWVDAYGALLASFLFGATFMGITTLFVSEARHLAPLASNKAIGYLTFVYGVGQMLGPSVAGVLIARSGNYHSALLVAASLLFCGMILLGIFQYTKRRKVDKYALR